MTREQLDKIKAKPHGPDVAALIAEVEFYMDVNMDADPTLADVYCAKCGFEIMPGEDALFVPQQQAQTPDVPVDPEEMRRRFSKLLCKSCGSTESQGSTIDG